MADPSMDRQEFYVATSRSREETYLYATAEIDSGREEFAPPSVEDRGPLGQLAQATERDRAQSAAHDEAKKAELAKLSTPEVRERYWELVVPAHDEEQHEGDYTRQVSATERCREGYERAVAEREAAEGLPWRERREELPVAQAREQGLAESLSKSTEKLQSMEPPTDSARREQAIAERLLTERTEQALAAARIKPPSYVKKELGERPSDPTKAKAWDRGVRGIEGYRRKYGVTDKNSALGKKAKGASQRAARARAQRRVQEAQRRLGRVQQLGRSRDTGRGFGIGL
jgi:hypothetical protein